MQIKNSEYIFHKAIGDVLHTYWMCSILCPNDKVREPLRGHLTRNGIETRPTFYPVHTMPMYSKKFERHINAEFLGWRGINLPSYPGLKETDIDFIVNAIINFRE